MQSSSVNRPTRAPAGKQHMPSRKSATSVCLQPPDFPPKNILVVDDVLHVAAAIETLLTTCGHHVETAPNGRDALAKFKRGKFDLIITDYAMPVMNGVKLAQKVREKAPDQLIILVTAFAFSMASFEASPLPVNLVMQKPFSPKELQEAMVRLFPQ